MRKVVGSLAAVLASTVSTSAAAAVELQVSGSGQLTGATGVSVRDARFDGIVSYSTYDVSFEEGTCSALFTGCDAASDFTMADSGGDSLAAYYAAQALLDQVFIGAFDTDPALTYGCGSPFFCEVLVPYRAEFGLVYTSNAFNSTAEDTVSSGLYYASDDTTNGPVSFNNTTVFARFTPSAIVAVPEPATWAMMLLGFGGMGIAFRRRKPVFSMHI